MVARRRLLGGGVLGGVLGILATDKAEAADAAAAQRDRLVDDVAPAIDKLRQELHAQRMFTELGAVRDAQLTFLRANGKLPDFIEVSSDVWLGVHDWHVRWQQPMTLGRDVIGRYTITLMQTTLILRPEVQGSFMSLPYDNK